jgi:hypothetical protein
MPNGEKANAPDTKYYVYEFLYNDKVFYVGYTYHFVCSHDRWHHVNNLLKRGKTKLLNNLVLAALIDDGVQEHSLTVAAASLPRHSVTVTTRRDAELWEGLGQRQAKSEKKKQIAKRLSEGCVLAIGRRSATLDDVLRYLGVAPKTIARGES